MKVKNIYGMARILQLKFIYQHVCAKSALLRRVFTMLYHTFVQHKPVRHLANS